MARTLFWIYESLSRLQHMLFYWYFLLCFNYYIRPKETSSDSTQSRDQQLNQQTLPETPVPDTEVFITIRSQIIFLWHNCINKIFNIVTFTANAPTLYLHLPINLLQLIPSIYLIQQDCTETNN